MAADQLFLGNIITMEPGHPTAQALTVKDGRVQFAGSVETARALCDESTQVLDFGDNCIYPGVIEGHCHPDLAGMRLKLQADLTPGASMPDYVDIMKAFIEANPGAIEYRGGGWIERECPPTAAMLDAICPDVPCVMNSVDGHSMWLNTAALKEYEIDAAAIEQWGTECIRVDEQGNPTGYLSEGPCFKISTREVYTTEQKEAAMLAWQDFAFSKGITACLHAGVIDSVLRTYLSLVEKGLWKLRTYALILVDEHEPDYVAKVQQIKELADKYNSEYFTIVGAKVFMDGVVEAHTAWLIDPYDDDPQAQGVKRMCDEERFTDMVAAACEEGLLVHCHVIGDGAIKFAVDCIEAAQKRTGIFTCRHALAHLQITRDEDIKRIADQRISPLVAPLWTPIDPVYRDQYTRYIGEERYNGQNKIKSFIDAGAPTSFHTDFPVSTHLGVPLTVYNGVTRRNPDADLPAHQPEEVITRQQALEGLTVNPAYSVHQEANLGQLTPGYVANMVVFDKNFLTDDLEEAAEANLLATIVDGQVVYSA